MRKEPLFATQRKLPSRLFDAFLSLRPIYSHGIAFCSLVSFSGFLTDIILANERVLIDVPCRRNCRNWVMQGEESEAEEGVNSSN